MRFNNAKIIKLERADIHLHYANNKGRGSDNVTVTVVKHTCRRPAYTRGYDNCRDSVLKQYRTSGWNGNVNIRNGLIDNYGGIQGLSSSQ